MLPREHSAILSTFIKLPFSIKTFVLSIFKWPLKTGFTVCIKDLAQRNNTALSSVEFIPKTSFSGDSQVLHDNVKMIFFLFLF